MQFLLKALLVACFIAVQCHAINLRKGPTTTTTTTSYKLVPGTCYAVEMGLPVTFSSAWNAEWTTPRLDVSNLYSHGVTGVPPNSWVAGALDGEQWIQVTSIVPVAWTGIITQGRADYNQWVTQYSVSYTSDGRVWTDVDGGKAFNANTDGSSKVTNMFSTPVVASTLRIRPTAWNSYASMRFDATFQRLAQ